MKKTKIWLASALAALLLCAFSPAHAGGLPRREDAFHTGQDVSDAYVDPEKHRIDESRLKATGYEYDHDALTYELVWAEEFDGEGKPDPAFWRYDTGGSGWGNHELQYYTRGDNAHVADGVLTIEARKERMGGMAYTSCRMVTRNAGDWLYCKVEARAKLPAGVGTWPAVWMLPTDWAYGSWPASGEIDIMEHVGYNPNVIVQSIHVERYHGGAARNRSLRVPGVCEDFHTYGVEWLPDQIIFSVDGNVTWTYRPADFTASPTREVWPFDRRMHLLVHLAFGGDWGGAGGIDENSLPAAFQVDYIRVYQSPEILALTGQTD